MPISLKSKLIFYFSVEFYVSNDYIRKMCFLFSNYAIFNFSSMAFSLLVLLESRVVECCSFKCGCFSFDDDVVVGCLVPKTACYEVDRRC